ncbi:cobalamin biosynthesis protein CobG [Kitasatospora sp. NPDC049258]|uniref:cobalamin biosynthesis protein CobG n=1 Tax=Kitasatospora sp. NPDC049258 TaxID=3155394 RepID=UPI0034373A4C
MPPEPAAAAPGPAVPDRGQADACPGALRLHRADDGALARVRVPGGLLTGGQLRVLATAAEELGDGELETTSRGNLQLRGLGSDAGLELGTRLRAAGLLPSDAHERVRNIVASPLAGLDGRGHADVQAWVRELDRRLCASDWAVGLSGKFLFALDDGRGDVAALDADVTLIARPAGAALLRLGRAATARPVPAGAAVDAALAAARDFLAALRATGTAAWHLREAPDLLDPGPLPLPAFDDPYPRPGALPGGLCVGLRFGRAPADRWRLLADAAPDGLRLTPWRGAVLPAAAGEWLPRLAAAGFRTEPGTAWDGATACTGTPGCARSLADVRADARAALDAAGRPGLPVHWSGCARRCGHPGGDWVDVLATGQGYRVTRGAASVEVTTHEMAEAVAEARRTT